MHHLFSGCTNWLRLEKGKGKKRAAGVPATSVAACAWIACVDIYALRFALSRLACSLPGAGVQLLSQSPHLHAQGELHSLAKSTFIFPPLPPSTLASTSSARQEANFRLLDLIRLNELCLRSISTCRKAIDLRVH
jgi:hypothetical protein